MYYSYSCPVCGRIFYTFNDQGWYAAQTLYNGIEKHMTDYTEHGRDTSLENKPNEDLDTVYKSMSSSTDKPGGGYSLD